MNDSRLRHDSERERVLDSLEEHFWLLEKITTRSHTLVVQLQGVASEEEWREGFSQVQAHHPMLNTSIGKRPGERPYFYRVPNRPLPIDFLELTNSGSLESIAEGELLRSFGNGQDSLTRVTVFRGEHQTVIMITSHHAALDGKAHLQIVQDVLAVISGGHLQPSREPLPPSTATRFGRTIPEYAGRSPLNLGDPEIQPTHAIPPKRHTIPVHDERRQLATENGFGSVGWHTFRHTYRTLLSGEDTPMDVQQKLMQHAQISTTQQYGGPPMENQRRANSKVSRKVLFRQSAG